MNTENSSICSVKHAYLIIAHKNDHTFHTLLTLLDDARNDIFVHMDAKCKSYVPDKVEKAVRHSALYHAPNRLNVQWGGYSQIRAELLLLEQATSHGHYAYYHLLSGEDLPIKPQDSIHAFFDLHRGKEFVHFADNVFHHEFRVSLYHLFQESLGRSHGVWGRLNNLFLRIQRLLKIQRSKDVVFQHGANWFSITDQLARFVLGQSAWIHSTFKNTQCADEIFLQTIVHNSEYAGRLFHPRYDDTNQAIMRLIDWERGEPYIWRISDKQELLQSNMLFARKFNSEVDRDIIDFISSFIKSQS